MSQENVEVVRRIYREGLMDRDHARLVDEFATPNIEYVNPREAVEPGVRRGRDQVAEAMRQSSESFDSSRHELHELFDGGDTVVASVSFSARSGGSEREVVQEEAHTWPLREGRIVRFEWGRDLGSALEAAGLRGEAGGEKREPTP
jgi:ketosteroid isomerase-like protein